MKLKSALPLEDSKLEITFTDGISGVVDLSEYLEFIGVLEILKDKNTFNKVSIKDNAIHWTEDCELSPETIYSIITNKKIFVDGKVVFDPALKKNAWIKN
jgi:hypothetical protein